MMPWRPAGRKAGWRSTATLPVGGPQRHVISLYSRTAGLFGRTINPNTLKHLDTTLRLATERLLEQARSERVHSLYRALLAGENLAFHASSERQLLQRACAGIAENGLFQTAWIGRPQEDGMFGVLVAAGSGASALHELRIPVSDQEQGALVVRAWRDGRMHYNNDHLEDPQLQSWADFLRRHRWHAAAAVPLRRGNECWAVLAVVSDERGAFDQETLHLIARIGRLIGHALDEMDTKSALDDARQQALYLAHHDALTGLANRLVFEHHVPKAQARVLRAETLMAVGLLDLDDFKPVNDTWGHEAGDALLRRLSERLQEVLRESDCLCRLGGDEFAFVIEDLSGWESLDAILARLRAAVEAPVTLPGGQEVCVHASLGLTLFPLDEESPDQLLRHADIALYEAKADKGGQGPWYRLYDTRWVRMEPRIGCGGSADEAAVTARDDAGRS